MADVPGFLRAVARPEKRNRKRLSAGRQNHAVVCDGAVDHGYASQRHHVHLHHWPILRGRHEVRPVLFWTACSDGDLVGHRGSHLSSSKGVYGLRVSGEPLRCEDPRAGERHLFDPARTGRGVGALCARRGAVGDSWLVGPDDHDPDGQPGGALHHDGRYQGDHLGRRAADGRDLRRVDSCPVHGHPPDAATGEFSGCGDAGRSLRKAEGRGYELRLEQPL